MTLNSLNKSHNDKLNLELLKILILIERHERKLEL